MGIDGPTYSEGLQNAERPDVIVIIERFTTQFSPEFPDEIEGFKESFIQISEENQQKFSAIIQLLNTNVSQDELYQYFNMIGFPEDTDMIEEFIIQMEPKLQVERGDLESSDSDIRQDFLTLKFNEIFRKPQYADIIKDAESRIPDSTILGDRNLAILSACYNELLARAKQESPADFIQVYEYLSAIQQATNDRQLFPDLSKYTGVYNGIKKLLTNPESAVNSEIILRSEKALVGYDGGTDLKVEGKTLSFQDQMVDLSEIPPKRYIVSPETGYKLESGTVDYRPDRESQKHKKGLEKEYAQNNEALTKIEGQQQGLQARKEGVEQADLTTDTVNDQLYRLYINDNQIKGLIERVDTARESGQDTQELESQLRAALIHKIDGEITSLLQQQQELQQRNTEIEEQIAVIDSKEAQRLQAYQEQLRLKDIQARKTRDFLSSIGFDLIPQSTTDQVIATLNSNTGLRAQLGITGEINLAEGRLGINKDGGDIEINAAEKTVFAKLVNRMISGSEDRPINVLAIQSGSGVPVQNRTAFKAELGEIVNTNGYGVAMENLRNSLGQDVVKNSYGEEWTTGSGGKVVSDGSGKGYDVMGGGGN